MQYRYFTLYPEYQHTTSGWDVYRRGFMVSMQIVGLTSSLPQDATTNLGQLPTWAYPDGEVTFNVRSPDGAGILRFFIHSNGKVNVYRYGSAVTTNLNQLISWPGRAL